MNFNKIEAPKTFKKRDKCLNCIHFTKQSTNMGDCIFLKRLVNYKFAYAEENFNIGNGCIPKVHKFARCDNYVHKSMKSIKF